MQMFYSTDYAGRRIDTIGIDVLLLFQPGRTFTFCSPGSVSLYRNDNDAKGDGVELTVSAKPFKATAVSGWVDYDHAVLTSNFPNGAGYVTYLRAELNDGLGYSTNPLEFGLIQPAYRRTVLHKGILTTTGHRRP
jgi:hypothetical protein